jgi:hypothetical protein
MAWLDRRRPRVGSLGGAGTRFIDDIMIIQPSCQFVGSDMLRVEVDSSGSWDQYLDQLDWKPGCRDRSGYLAFLRAGSLAVEPDAAIKAVADRIKAAGGSFTPSKLQSQLRRAYEYAGSAAGETSALVKPAKVVFVPEKLREIAAKAPGIDPKYVASRSPSPLLRNSAMFLNELYRPGEKVLVFTDFQSQGQVLFNTGAVWSAPLPTRTDDGAWFLINPVDGEYHPNPRQQNKPSRRSEESITSWRFLLLESDVAPREEWLACLVQLPLKIVAIYSSGGKSIHALVRLDATSKADWDAQRDEIKPIVVELGADENALTGVRLSRLPCVIRGTKRQHLFYLNANATGAPIVTLPVAHKYE